MMCKQRVCAACRHMSGLSLPLPERKAVIMQRGLLGGPLGFSPCVITAGGWGGGKLLQRAQSDGRAAAQLIAEECEQVFHLAEQFAAGQ